jgi:hypothetical protein
MLLQLDFFLSQQRLCCLPLGFIKCGFEQASIARDVEATDQGLHRLVMLRCHGLFLSPDCRQMQENRHPDGFRSTSWIGHHVAIRIAARSRQSALWLILGRAIIRVVHAQCRDPIRRPVLNFWARNIRQGVRDPLDQLCVQRRLACSAGDKPAGAKVRSPVVWIAGWRETKTLKPIDKVSLGEITSHRAVTRVNAQVASKMRESEGRACN